MSNQELLDSLEGTEIAIVGMACRFPGANNVDEYWKNLRDGVEAVTFYSDETLRAAGVPESLLRHPHYVKSGTHLDKMEQFDAAFFGFGPRDAAIMDPQHRHFLECAWEALEYAGYDPKRFNGSIGVFGGSGHNAYMPYNLLTNPDLVNSVGFFLLRHTGNDKDFLTTRVSYIFDLKGPSVNVQTACSTSLVAMHMASQSLLNRECDMALAGGVTIELPHHQGYLFHEGEILSPDGHCRAFDADSEGTIFGSGVGIVVLKRLADAIEAGDTIHAVLRASAINNDGSGKVNYLAPSVDGQAAAIAEAIALAGITADTITYVEAHGTGTRIGDPIEVTALTQAFRATTDQKQYCGIGSVKTNIGHLDTAAGVASVIKTVQALKHKQIPATLNWKAPNPMIDFPNSPFYVNSRLQDWEQMGGFPRRAGVSSLGVGGTNAHIILEEAPALEPSGESRPFHLFLLSAKTLTALDKQTTNLAEHLRQHPETNLADVAYTLQTGRQPFNQRRLLVAKDTADALTALENNDRKRLISQVASDNPPSVVFMFPGGGAQYPNMGRDLYHSEPVYRQEIDNCLKLSKLFLKADLRSLMYPPEGADLEAVSLELQKPSLALPALFMTEYALAKLWMSWGIEPSAMTGHSMGEYTAACLAGVFSVQDALAIVTWRGQLFETLPEGAMLSVQLSEAEIRPFLPQNLDLATINAPSLCSISGSIQAIDEMEKVLADKGIEYRRIKIDVAAHSQMLDPILAEFRQRLSSKIRFKQPNLPFISNVSGTWAKTEEVTTPDYWVRHLRHTVRFADGLATLMKEDANRVFLEVGPGTTLAAFTRMHPEKARNHTIVNGMRHIKEEIHDQAFVLGAFGRLWLAGVVPDWDKFYEGERRYRLPLPTYPFDHQRYWIEPGKQLFTVAESAPVLAKMPDLADWFYQMKWRAVPLAAVTAAEPMNWLVFKDELGVAEKVIEQLEKAGHGVVTVLVGEQFRRVAPRVYAINPRARIDYDALMADLTTQSLLPQRVAHFWPMNYRSRAEKSTQAYHYNQDLGFYSLFFLAQAFGEVDLPVPVHMTVFSNGMHAVQQEIAPYPEKATLLGPVKVIPSEFPTITCQSVDLELAEGTVFGRRQPLPDVLLASIWAELNAPLADQPVVAYRHHQRWVQGYETAKVTADLPALRLKPNGTYLITGGLGGIGLVMAEYLAQETKANLVLIGRSALPPRTEWDSWLKSHAPGDKTSRQIRKVRELEAFGGRVLPLSADVTNREQMTTAVSQARQQFGDIHGVIHAAGVLHDNLIQLKTPEEADKVLNPKVRGALLLDELLRDLKLDFFVLFSSTSTLLGSVGQVDYVAANDFLNAFAASRTAQTGQYTVAINWGVWQQVGMAVEAARRLGLVESHEPEGVEVAHPLLERLVVDTPDELMYATEYSVQKHWLLDQHRLKGGKALVPGTGYLEIAKAALEKGTPNGPVEIRELYFITPLEVPDEGAKEVHISLAKNGGGDYEFAVSSKTADSNGAPIWQEHARGFVGSGSITTSRLYHMDTILESCQEREVKFAPKQQETRQETYLDFGPRWKNLRQINYGKQEALALLELPEEFVADLDNYHLHPSLVDLATGFALPLIEGYETSDDFYVPLSYRRVRINAALPRKIYSYARLRVDGTTSKEVPAFDVTILDENGRILVDVQEFTMKRVSPAAMISGSRPENKRIGLKTGGEKNQPGAEAPLLRLALTDGIAPSEGAEAFRRILANPLPPQVIVSSLNLDVLLKEVKKKETAESETATGFKLSRPNLGSSYEAPRNEIEKVLVKFWQELLGVDEIGVHDDFFELGGHSLIAVRLFNKIKKSYSVDFSLATLFETPTVAQLAALIQEEVGETAVTTPDPITAEPKTTPARKRTGWSYLVPIQPKGHKPPFFCVHGALGNVLNFYDLTRYLGSEQPFYGLQAQGVDGKRPAFKSMSDMVTAYLKEIRVIQPHGPYYLGGFSLGGEVAIAMAQQLKNEGESVALVALLDTLEPERSRPDARLKGMLQSFQTGGGLKGRLRYTRRWLEVQSRLIRRRFKVAYLNWDYERRLRGEQEISQNLIGPYLWEAHTDVLTTYTHRPYNGRVVLFRASDTEGETVRNSMMTWERLIAEQLIIHVIKGTHNIVKEPYVGELAKLLQEELNRLHKAEA